MVFKIKKSTPFAKVIAAYAKKISADAKSLRLHFDGNRIEDTDTPESLGMEDNEQVDASLEQQGGAATLL